MNTNFVFPRPPPPSLTVGQSVEQTVDGGHVFDNATLLHAAHKLVLVQVPSRELKLLDVVVGLRRRLLALRRHLAVGRKITFVQT